MDIKNLQEEVNIRWSLQLNNPCHKSADANHALIHMTKALGKLASALNEAEHEERIVRSNEVSKYLADLVICAARFSDGVVDLDEACVSRLAEKFPKQEGYQSNSPSLKFFTKRRRQNKK
jgi:hypothetical protein